MSRFQKPLRMTRQRQVIVEEMKKTAYHPTADEVYEMARKRLPRVSLGTIYRNLEVLASEGVIRKVETEGSQKRFDGNPEPHYHIRCSKCGALEDVRVQWMPPLEDFLKDSQGYEIRGWRLEFVGLCPLCRKKDSSRNGEPESPELVKPECIQKEEDRA